MTVMAVMTTVMMGMIVLMMMIVPMVTIVLREALPKKKRGNLGIAQKGGGAETLARLFAAVLQ